MEPTAVDWRDMFRRYADLVGEEEGVDFLNRGDWTPEERSAIDDAVTGTVRWPPFCPRCGAKVVTKYHGPSPTGVGIYSTQCSACDYDKPDD